MATITIGRTAQALGKQFNYAKTITADNALVSDPASIAAAKTGTLTTRTSDTAGTLTMDSGHGFTDGQVIDIYWADGQCTEATIGTVATNSVPFTGATGDVLPLADTAITAMVQRSEPFSAVDGDIQALCVAASGGVACSVTFYASGGSAVGAVRVRPAVSGASLDYVWDVNNGANVPVSNDVASIGMTHADSASARQVTCLALVN